MVLFGVLKTPRIFQELCLLIDVSHSNTIQLNLKVYSGCSVFEELNIILCGGDGGGVFWKKAKPNSSSVSVQPNVGWDTWVAQWG